MDRLWYVLLVCFTFWSCDDKDPDVPIEDTTELLESINSASVVFSYSDTAFGPFFTAPSLAYISGYFYFEETLAPDVIFGLDIEHLEGVNTPVRFEGADWMALAGFTRDGLLWFPIGAPENLEGVPTPTENWEVRDFEVNLLPGTWYKMTITCNFDALEFVSVSLEGDGVDKTVSLSGFPLEYPNYAPFDTASITGYTFAIRGEEFSPDNAPGYEVYFDDIQMGIFNGASFDVVFEDSFENQLSIGEIPITAIPIPMEDIQEDRWYLENDDAKLEIVSNIKRSGNAALKCSANLRR